MSLIHVEQQVRGPHLLTRAALAALVISVGIIAGLLAMHSFNSHATTAGHHGTVAVSTQSGAHEHHHDAASAALQPNAPATPEGCASCGGGDPMTWMACVLALLVATIAFGRVGLGWRHIPLTAIPAITTRQWHARALSLPPPPSLTVLCISRT